MAGPTTKLNGSRRFAVVAVAAAVTAVLFCFAIAADDKRPRLLGAVVPRSPVPTSPPSPAMVASPSATAAPTSQDDVTVVPAPSMESVTPTAATQSLRPTSIALVESRSSDASARPSSWADALPRALPMETLASTALHRHGGLNATSLGGSDHHTPVRVDVKGTSVHSALVYPAVPGTCVGAVVSTFPQSAGLLSCDRGGGAEAPKLSADPRVQRWAEHVAGPHAFNVFVSGESTTFGASALRHGGNAAAHSDGRGGCQYVHSFHAAVPGAHEVAVTLVLTGFRAVDETKETVSTFHKYHIARFSFECARAAAAVVADGTRPSMTLAYVNVHSLTEQKELARTGAASGTALRYYPWAGKDLRLVSVRRNPDTTGTSSFPTEAALLPGYHLQPGRLLSRCAKESSAAVQAPVPLRVWFTGDSHMRTLFRQLESVLKNDVAVLAKGGNLTVASRAVEAHFLWDPYLEAFPGRIGGGGGAATSPFVFADRFDLVVFGMGAWPASFGQWRYAEYAARIERIADSIGTRRQSASAGTTNQKKQDDPLFIFAGAPAIPKPRKMPGFRITNGRLGVFNSIGRALLEPIGVRWLDLFGMTHPVPKLHRGDAMHFDRSVVLYSAVDWLLSTVCGTVPAV